MPPEYSLDANNANVYHFFQDRDLLRVFGTVVHDPSSSDNHTRIGDPRDTDLLEDLVALGLVVKTEADYSPTPMGAGLFQEQIRLLRETLVQSTAAHLLRQFGNQSEDNDNKSTQRPDLAALETSNYLLGDLRSVSGISELEPIKIFSDWLGICMQTALLIEKMKDELYVATKYMDFRTAEIALNSAKMGRKINILHGAKDVVASRLMLVSNLMSNPRAAKIYSEFSKHPNIKTREGNVPFTFVVVDRSKVLLEIVNPQDPSTFFLAYFFDNHLLAEKLLWLYNDSIGTSHEDQLRQNLEEASARLERRKDSSILTA